VLKVITDILRVFDENNLFNEGIELIGSWCFQMYQKHLGAKSFPLRTQDVDFLIPNPYLGSEHLKLVEQLERLGFTTDFRRDGSLYLWNAELRIEFMTPEKGRGADHSIRIKKLGLNAMPLRFVALLLDNPITIVEDGIKILIPNPINFCLHKLIIASRRRKIDKSLKDLQQAVCTSVIVDAKKMQELFISLPKKWRSAIIRMLDKADSELPLLKEDIDSLQLTLQNVEK
jgi:hypothetical protein